MLDAHMIQVSLRAAPLLRAAVPTPARPSSPRQVLSTLFDSLAQEDLNAQRPLWCAV